MLQKRSTLFLCILSILLLGVIFSLIHYLTTNNYITKCYENYYNNTFAQ